MLQNTNIFKYITHFIIEKNTKCKRKANYHKYN